jgi:hypothetical protein
MHPLHIGFNVMVRRLMTGYPLSQIDKSHKGL